MKKSICRHEEILAAWNTYRNTVPDEDPEAFRQAYALLAQNRILTEDAAEELRQRYRFEQQKIIDYDKRLPELNRRYRNLKYLQQMTAAPDWTVEQIKREFSTKQPQSLADLDSLPDPDVLAADIIENLQSAMDSFKELMEALGK